MWQNQRHSALTIRFNLTKISNKRSKYQKEENQQIYYKK